MPRKRPKPGKKLVKGKLYIFCEGSKNKSESSYLQPLIDSLNIPNTMVEIIDTKKNTGKELVNEAKKKREVQQDILWVVYDKDGYTKHPDTFDLAQAAGIKIAFSSICFEIWVLLHFIYISKPFNKSDEVIKYIQNNCKFDYRKNISDTYSPLKDKLQDAISRAKKLREEQFLASCDKKIHNLNPYTNFDELIECIFEFERNYNSKLSVLE